MSQVHANGQAWNGRLLGDFANQVGTTLDQLGQEYEDMMLNFEEQKSQLKNFSPSNGAILEEGNEERIPSPTPSNSSKNSATKDHDNRRKSSSGISSSIRAAKNSLRRKLSSKSQSPSHRRLSRRKDHSSVSSLSKNESEGSGIEHETLEVTQKT